LLESSGAWIAAAEETLGRHGLHGIAGVELSENIPGDQRACHLELHAGAETAPYAVLANGVTGLSAQRADRLSVDILSGAPVVTDVLGELTLRRDVRAFFQGNRFLVGELVGGVLDAVPPDMPVVDLYAGVGLFGLSLAVRGGGPVTLVEGDPISGADLERNASPFGERVRVERKSVELFLAGWSNDEASTFIVDPPRTGMSRDALTGIIAAGPAVLVYVSCDVATLARDARLLLDAGYDLRSTTGLDLFPNTAHVETMAVFAREPDN
jgi:23S rRNA (uracil1939-C5)-methyltransferase